MSITTELSGDPELQEFIRILETTMTPSLLDQTCSAIIAWRRLIVSRERARLMQVLTAAIDLDLIAEGVEWAVQSDTPAETIVAALQARAAAEPTGRPS